MRLRVQTCREGRLAIPFQSQILPYDALVLINAVQAPASGLDV